MSTFFHAHPSESFQKGDSRIYLLRAENYSPLLDSTEILYLSTRRSICAGWTAELGGWMLWIGQ
jgi:hypothetical protein